MMLFENVERICKARGISIARLERETGLGNATVRGWKNSTPSVANLKRVADYLGVDMDELLSDPPAQSAGEG